MSDLPGGQEPNDDLISRGWRQGAVFRAGEREIIAVCNVLPSDENNQTFTTRRIKDREWLLLITHDCDMARDKMPAVVALICSQLDLSKDKDQRALSRVGIEEPRKFVVSRRNGVVAESYHRVVIDIGVLKDMDGPDFYVDDVDMLREWLAKKYARDVNQDQTHNVVISPLVERLREIKDNHKDHFARYTTLVKHVRFRIQDANDGVWRTSLLVIPIDLGDQLTDAHIDSLEFVNRQLESVLDEHEGTLSAGVTVVLLDELRFLEFMRSTAVPLDWASWHDDTTRRGEPPIGTLEQLG